MLLALLLATAAPAPASELTAEPAHEPVGAALHRRPTAEAVVKALRDSQMQQAAALEIASLAGIVLDTRVGPLAALTDPADHVRANDTLRDVIHRRDPDAERHLYERSRRVIATAGTVAAGSLAEVAELRRTADRLHAALAPLAGVLNGGQ